MEVYHNLTDLPSFENAVITIGSFDGVHAGHQKLFERINILAKENHGKAKFLLLQPHQACTSIGGLDVFVCLRPHRRHQFVELVDSQ